MTEKKIREIAKDIEAYTRAIEDAEGALAEAERELEEALQAYADETQEGEIGNV